MRLNSVRVRNFRTVGAVDQTMPLDRPVVLVGANNSGKTNLMRAVQMLFTGHENAHGYLRDADLPFGRSNVKTSIVAVFDGDDSGTSTEDRAIYEQLDRLYALYGRSRPDATVTLHLVFSPSGTPVYQFFPNLKKPEDNASQAAISRTQRQLVTDLLGRFVCHYIPSAKSIQQLYDEFLNPFLRSVAAAALEPQVEALKAELQTISEGVSQELAAVGLHDLRASFDLPAGSTERLLSSFDFNMKDPHETPISRKGQGIQSAAFFAALQWVTAQEATSGTRVIWLLEEPEAYLHPKLMTSVRAMVERLSTCATVVLSTHALSFVPADPTRILGTRVTDSGTEVSQYSTYTEATKDIRANLGVRFSDYYNLSEYNVAVEGKSDREMLAWIVAKRRPVLELQLLPKASVLDFGGVKFLAGWLRATYEHIRVERALVVLFDGDQAGELERRGLGRYFGNHQIPWNANRHYVIGRAGFPIEALFPDSWLADLWDAHSNWFEDFAVDASGALQAFTLKDSHKAQAQAALMARADDDASNAWSARWDALLVALETGLEWQQSQLD